MLELKKSNDETAEKSLGQQVEIRARRQDVTIECMDINQVTTKNVRVALEKVFELPRLQESAVKSMRKVYKGTQTAVISLVAETTLKILPVRKVKIGWVNCRFFRCLDLGHITAVYTSAHDRPKQYRKTYRQGVHS